MKMITEPRRTKASIVSKGKARVRPATEVKAVMSPAVGHVSDIGITAIEIGCKITAVEEVIAAAVTEDHTEIGGTNGEVEDTTTTIVVEGVITEEEEMEVTTTGTIDNDDPVATTGRNLLRDTVVGAIAIARTREARHLQAEVAQYLLRVAVKRIVDTAVTLDPDLLPRPRSKTNQPNRKAPNP